MQFCTLARAVEITGIGLHTGTDVTATLHPREEVGIVFVRYDLPDAPEVPASYHCITTTHHATTLAQNNVKIGTPEHLLSALYCMGITHCRVEISASEVPILDGSAAPWCEIIERAGLLALEGTRPEYSLSAPIVVEANGGAVIGLPYPHLRVTADVEYGLEYLAPQLFAANITTDIFVREVAPARTFALENWIEPLQSLGLIRGGSIENALLLSASAASSPLRFENELARHKVLDALGDIALLFGADGGLLHAHIVAVRAGHELHRQWMEKALNTGSLSCIA